MPKFQLHVSGLNMLSRCGEQFRRRYIEGEKLRPGVAIAIGVAVDRTVTQDLSNKITSGELLPDEAIKDYARDECVAAFERGIELDSEYAEMGEEKARATAIDTSVILADLHHGKVAPRLFPTHVQREWVLDVNGLPVQLAGTIDVQEGALAIRDTKTSKKSPPADTAAKSLQLTTYALAVRQCDGKAPASVALDYLVHTKEPKLVQLVSTRTDKDFPHLMERIYQASVMIEKGVFMPAPIDSWWCDAKWCGYFNTCRFAARPVTIAA